jgi:hypothetical protein
MKSLNKWLPILGFALGFLMIYGGAELEVPILIHAGLVPIGGTVMVWGADAIITRRSSYTIGEDNQREETYRGFAAMADGLVLLIIGFAIISAGVVLLLGFEQAVLGYLQLRPGVALLFGGGLATMYGLTLMLGSQQENQGGLRTLASIPARIFGFILFILGAGGLVLGLLEILLPNTFHNALGMLRGLLPALQDFEP